MGLHGVTVPAVGASSGLAAHLLARCVDCVGENGRVSRGAVVYNDGKCAGLEIAIDIERLARVVKAPPGCRVLALAGLAKLIGTDQRESVSTLLAGECDSPEVSPWLLPPLLMDIAQRRLPSTFGRPPRTQSRRPQVAVGGGHRGRRVTRSRREVAVLMTSREGVVGQKMAGKCGDWAVVESVRRDPQPGGFERDHATTTEGVQHRCSGWVARVDCGAECVPGDVATGHCFLDEGLKFLLLGFIIWPREQGANHGRLRLSCGSGGKPCEKASFGVSTSPASIAARANFGAGEPSLDHSGHALLPGAFLRLLPGTRKIASPVMSELNRVAGSSYEPKKWPAPSAHWSMT